MRTQELNYDLPQELVAQEPSQNRCLSRLLVFERKIGKMTDSRFQEIGGFLKKGDCLVLNDTKVVPAKFAAKRKTGAKLEGLFLEEKCGSWEVLLKGSGKVKNGEKIILLDRAGREFCDAEFVSQQEDGKSILKIGSDKNAEQILNEIGFAPLPPYIKRDTVSDDNNEDLGRYQTVYAKNIGAVAAPTAGFHFTQELIAELKAAGILFAYVTLHVGIGTFKPIAVDDLKEHVMHYERYSIDAENADIINNARKNGGRIIAVGTTSVRTLESIAENGMVKESSGSTNLFITPGYKFKMVDCMITNFHLPKSTLLALVAAFAGLENVMNVYRHAIEKKYRFYSYGDAMMILS